MLKVSRSLSIKKWRRVGLAPWDEPPVWAGTSQGHHVAITWPDWHTIRDMIKFRISTALMCVGLVFLPWTAYLVPPPAFIVHNAVLSKAFTVVVYQISGQFLYFGFGAALVSLGWFAFKRQWPVVGQFLFEMALCVGAVSVLPAY